MDRRLQQLESFTAKGSDGRSYKVRAYEHQVRDEAWPDAITGWESTGEAEYRLDDGRKVDVHRDGRMEIAESGVELMPDGTLH